MKIIDPLTNKKFSIVTQKGRDILIKYIKAFKYGGKFIGTGAEKCVYHPPLECRDGTKFDNSKISAIMKTKDTENEWDETREIKRIDPTGKYTIIPEHICPIGRMNNKDRRELGNCKHLGHNIERDFFEPTEFQQLIMRFGGKDLKKIHIGLYERSIDPSILIELYKNLYQLSDAYRFLKNNNYIHGDSKPNNLVYKQDENKYYIIDFGLSTKLVNYSDLRLNDLRSNKKFQKVIDMILTYGDTDYQYWAKCMKITVYIMFLKLKQWDILIDLLSSEKRARKLLLRILQLKNSQNFKKMKQYIKKLEIYIKNRYEINSLRDFYIHSLN